MIEQDTIRLLRECDSGIKMGISSIDDVLDYVHDPELKSLLSDSRKKHLLLQEDILSLLAHYKDEGKNPNILAKSMSWVKTNAKLIMHKSDKTIADLMTEGCDMGKKSLNRYLNEYKAADEKSKDIAKKLIKIEDDFSIGLRKFL